MKYELLKIGKKYKNSVVLSAGSSGAEVCEEFSKYFSDRYFNFGLAGGNMVSAASGFALMGKLPIVIGDGSLLFAEVFSQILNDVCIPNLNVKFVSVGECFSEFEFIYERFPNFSIKDSKDDFERMFLEYGPAYLKSI
jgi:transketolase C-terminal domain/subunit